LARYDQYGEVSDMTASERLIENLAAVRRRISDAARHSGRTADEITLVAVTKYVPAELAQQVVAAGCSTLGENRPQGLWAKAESLKNSPGQIHWHLIGHLQRNKVPRTLPLVSLLHSGDSLRLLQAVNRAAAELNRPMPVLLEVNISGDATKHGFRPAEMETALPNLTALQWLEIRGLMGMASREGDLLQARREFTALRELRDRLQRVAPPQLTLRELSMGMSGDFEVAIEEGATLVRIGSALFEGLLE
jgi:hypothetical protein